MKSINFNTGIKTYAINGDETNTISININDINLLKRIKDAENLFDPILARLDNEPKTPELLAEVDAEIKEKFNFIFGADISTRVFGNTNCLSPLDDGRYLFVSFFEAFAPIIIEDINKSRENFSANKEKSLAKYMPEAEKPDTVDLSKLTPEQLAYLKSLK